MFSKLRENTMTTLSRHLKRAMLLAILLMSGCLFLRGGAGAPSSATPCSYDHECMGAGRRCLKADYAMTGVCGSAPKKCSSDYDCDYGKRCIKGQFAFEGVCVQPVSSYGAPTYSPPNPNSIGPGREGNCTYDTECTPGFKCFKQNYSLTGHCIKAGY